MQIMMIVIVRFALENGSWQNMPLYPNSAEPSYDFVILCEHDRARVVRDVDRQILNGEIPRPKGSAGGFRVISLCRPSVPA